MKTHTEVRMLTIKMNFKNSREPHMGSSNFPLKRRPSVLATTYKTSVTWCITSHIRGEFKVMRRVHYEETVYSNISAYPMHWLFNITGCYEVPSEGIRPAKKKLRREQRFWTSLSKSCNIKHRALNCKYQWQNQIIKYDVFKSNLCFETFIIVKFFFG